MEPRVYESLSEQFIMERLSRRRNMRAIIGKWVCQRIFFSFYATFQT